MKRGGLRIAEMRIWALQRKVIFLETPRNLKIDSVIMYCSEKGCCNSSHHGDRARLRWQ